MLRVRWSSDGPGDGIGHLSVIMPPPTSPPRAGRLPGQSPPVLAVSPANRLSPTGAVLGCIYGLWRAASAVSSDTHDGYVELKRRTAMETRPVIDQAKGVLIAAHSLTSEAVTANAHNLHAARRRKWALNTALGVLGRMSADLRDGQLACSGQLALAVSGFPVSPRLIWHASGMDDHLVAGGTVVEVC